MTTNQSRIWARTWILAQIFLGLTALSGLLWVHSLLPALVEQYSVQISSALFFGGIAVLMRLGYAWTIARDLKTIVEEAVERSVYRPSDATLAALGVKNVFRDRESAMTAIAADLEDAQDRIWLVGVTLMSHFRLHERLAFLETKLEDNFKGTRDPLRILLADPLRSPAFFRMLLELEPPDAKKIVDLYRGQPPEDSNEVDQIHFMNEFDFIWKRIQARPKLRRCVRFYAHLFSTWSVVVDDTIYYQPCFLGPIATGERRAETSLGAGPVFRLERGEVPEFFESVLLHLDSLWFMTTTDVLEMKVRWEANRKPIIDKTFEYRRDWLNEVCNYRSKIWRRRSQRHRCVEEPAFTVTYEGVEAKGRLLDYSLDGLRVELNDPIAEINDRWDFPNRSWKNGIDPPLVSIGYHGAPTGAHLVGVEVAHGPMRVARLGGENGIVLGLDCHST